MHCVVVLSLSRFVGRRCLPFFGLHPNCSSCEFNASSRRAHSFLSSFLAPHHRGLQPGRKPLCLKYIVSNFDLFCFRVSCIFHARPLGASACVKRVSRHASTRNCDHDIYASCCNTLVRHRCPSQVTNAFVCSDEPPNRAYAVI